MHFEDIDIAIAALTRLRASLQADPALRAHVRTTPAEPTPRELEVLEHIKRGLSRASVARVLGMHLSRVNQIVASLRSKGVDVPGGVKRGAQLRVLDELKQAHEKAQAEYKLACEWMDDTEREAARVAAGQAKARYEKALGSVTLSPSAT
jgi:DNA-binding CsgD family transcriptional regulator